MQPARCSPSGSGAQPQVPPRPLPPTRRCRATVRPPKASPLPRASVPRSSADATFRFQGLGLAHVPVPTPHPQHLLVCPPPPSPYRLLLCAPTSLAPTSCSQPLLVCPPSHGFCNITLHQQHEARLFINNPPPQIGAIQGHWSALVPTPNPTILNLQNSLSPTTSCPHPRRD